MAEPSTMLERKMLNFALEDTSDRSYRDISSAMLHRGWNKVPYKKRSKLEKRRLPMKQVPLLIWTLHDKDIDYAMLQPNQLCNHFEGISALTTKRGFCDLLRDGMSLVGRDQYSVSPRGYNLGDPLHREEFVDDFHVSSCVNILKWAVLAIGTQYSQQRQSLLQTQTQAQARTREQEQKQETRRKQESSGLQLDVLGNAMEPLSLSLSPNRKSRLIRSRSEMNQTAPAGRLINSSSSNSDNKSCDGDCSRDGTAAAHPHQVPHPPASARAVSAEAETETGAPRLASAPGCTSVSDGITAVPLSALRIAAKVLSAYLRMHSGDAPGVETTSAAAAGSSKGNYYFSDARVCMQNAELRRLVKDTRAYNASARSAKGGGSSSSSSSSCCGVRVPYGGGRIAHEQQPWAPGAASSSVSANQATADSSSNGGSSNNHNNHTSTGSGERDDRSTGAAEDAVSASSSTMMSHVYGVRDSDMQQLLEYSYCIAENQSRNSHEKQKQQQQQQQKLKQQSNSVEESIANLEWMKHLHDIATADLPVLLRLSSTLPGGTSMSSTGTISTVPAQGGAPKNVTVSAAQLFGSNFHTRLLLLLHGCTKCPQLQFDLSAGLRNSWIVKAPDASCGLGLKLLYRLNDILSAERGMGGKNCQKYIENPLLYRADPNSGASVSSTANSTANTSPVPIPRRSVIAGVDASQIPNATLPVAAQVSQRTPVQVPALPSPSSLSSPPIIDRKFDLRVWVLVTSFFPLRAYIYSGVYGRACAVKYGLQVGDDAGNLSDPRVHFTNYSVQSQNQNQDGSTSHGSASASASSSNGSSAKVRSLRGTIDNFRNIGADNDKSSEGAAGSNGSGSGENGNGGTGDKDKADTRLGDLLVSTADVKACIAAHDCTSSILGTDACDSSDRDRDSGTWPQIWRSIHTKVLHTLLAARTALPIEANVAANGQPQQKHDSCFEFLGYDIILDSRTHEPYILEANLSPGIARRNADHAAMIQHMSQGLVQLAIVPHEKAQSGSSSGDAVSAYESSNLLESYQQQAQVQEYLLCGTPTGSGSSSASIDNYSPRRASSSEQHSPVSASSAIDSGSGECGQWEPLHRDDDCYDDPTVVEPLSVLNSSVAVPKSGYRTATTDIPPKTMTSEWVVTRSGNTATYTKVEKGASTSSTNTKPPPSRDKAVGVDIGFSLQGKAISSNGMQTIDNTTGMFAKILLLQKWARRYCIHRTRLWKVRCIQAVRKCQSIIRTYLRLCRAWHRRRAAAATTVQSKHRSSMAAGLLLHLRKSRCALLVQTKHRQNHASKVVQHLKRNVNAKKVQKWYRRYAHSWQVTNRNTIANCIRSWYNRRHRAKRIVRLLLHSHWRRCKRQRMIVYRFSQASLRQQYKYLCGRKESARRIADLCVHGSKHRVHRIKEAERLRVEHFDLCISGYIEHLITEDVFSVSVKDIWSAPEALAAIPTISAEKPKPKVRTLGLVLVEVCKEAMQEERDSERRRRIYAQDLLAEQHQQCRDLGIPIPKSLLKHANAGETASASGSVSSSESSPTQMQITPQASQRRLAFGERTRVLLTTARKVLASADFSLYKKHLFTLQDRVLGTRRAVSDCATSPNADSKTNGNSNTTGGHRHSHRINSDLETKYNETPEKELFSLPVELPAKLFEEYVQFQKVLQDIQSKERADLNTHQQEVLERQERQGKIVRYNGRVIDTSKFQSPLPPTEQGRRTNSKGSTPPGPATPTMREKEHLEFEREVEKHQQAPMSNVLRNMFADDVRIEAPTSTGIGMSTNTKSTSGKGKVPSLPPRPQQHSAAATKARSASSTMRHASPSPRRATGGAEAGNVSVEKQVPPASASRGSQASPRQPSPRRNRSLREKEQGKDSGCLPPPGPQPEHAATRPATSSSTKKMKKSRKTTSGRSASLSRATASRANSAAPQSPASVYSSKSLTAQPTPDALLHGPPKEVLADRRNSIIANESQPQTDQEYQYQTHSGGSGGIDDNENFHMDASLQNRPWDGTGFSMFDGDGDNSDIDGIPMFGAKTAAKGTSKGRSNGRKLRPRANADTYEGNMNEQPQMQLPPAQRTPSHTRSSTGGHGYDVEGAIEADRSKLFNQMLSGLGFSG